MENLTNTAVHLLEDSQGADLTRREKRKLSVENTKGCRWQIVGFYLSFIPWYLLCCLIVPLFYVVPYVAVASTMLAR